MTQNAESLTAGDAQSAMDVSDLLLVAQTIFTDGVNEFTTNDGKVVKLTTAKMKHLATITRFMNAVVGKVDQKSLAAIVTSILVKQKAALAKGQDPNKIDVREMAESVLMDGAPKDEAAKSEFVVTRSVNYVSIMFSLTAALMEELPDVVPAFTNLTKAEFEDMDPAEATIVAGGIFLMNYRFFTQSLRPVLGLITVNLVRKFSDNKVIAKSLKGGN
jgi:hypothetical protein